MTNDRKTKAYIHEQLEGALQAKIEALLLEGLDSGDATEITNEWWEQKCAQLVKKHRG